MTEATAFHWDSVPAEGDARVARKVIAGTDASLKRVQVAAGTVAGRHSHPHEQMVLILQGSGRLECAAGSVALRPDTVLHFDAGAWHSAVFETDTVLIEVNVSA